MGAGGHGVLQLFPKQHGADGKSAAQAFSCGYNVRSNAVLLVGKVGTGAAVAGLHFIYRDQNVFFLCQLGNGTYECWT